MPELPVLMNRRCGGAFHRPVDFTVAWNQNKEASIRLLFQGEQSLFGGLAGMPGGSVGRSHGSGASLISIEQASIPDIIFCRISNNTISVAPKLHLQLALVECDDNSLNISDPYNGSLPSHHRSWASRHMSAFILDRVMTLADHSNDPRPLCQCI